MKHPRFYFNGVAALLLGLALATQSMAEQVNLAVASNFMQPMAVLQAAFEQQSGHRLVVSYGSSGRLYAQIVNGAPFDLFLSADAAKPQALDGAGLTLTEPRVYATGQLVLWSRDSGVSIDGLDALQNPKVTKIAMANPRIAPYGLAARQVLDNAKIYGAVQGKLVLGENISQAYQFAYTRSAQVGFVALSQVIAAVPETDYWIVPPQLHEPIQQSAVMLNRAEGNSAAMQFFEFLFSDAAEKLITGFGYVTASNTKGNL